MTRTLIYACTIAVFAFAYAYGSTAIADDFDIHSDAGGVGLLQTPTARMAPDGEFGVGASVVHPYNQIHLTLQFLPWLETTVRYTDVVNRRYGPSSFSGTQSYKDKSADFKVRLVRQGDNGTPAIALGVQDVGGTGLFSSEYLVMSRSYSDFDLSLGLAWGRLGSRENIPNPVGSLSSHFDKPRSVADSTNSSAGGTGLGRLFTGQTVGVFGGVRWRTPIKGLYLDAEYDGINYRKDALSENLRSDLPVNFGLTYKVFSGVEIGAGYERGNTLMVRLMLTSNFQSMVGPGKVFDPPPSPIIDKPKPKPKPKPVPPASLPTPHAQADTKTAASAGLGSAQSRATLGNAAIGASAVDEQEAPQAQKLLDDTASIELLKALALQKFNLQGVTIDHSEHAATLWYTQDIYRNPAKAVGRVARIMSELLPGDIRSFVIIQSDNGMEDFHATIRRKDLEAAVDPKVPEQQRGLTALLSAPSGSVDDAEYRHPESFPKFSYDMSPQLRQSIDGPDSFYLYQFWWRMTGNVQVTRHLSLTSTIGINIYNNFNKIKLQSNSVLPHVRSDIASYLKEGPNNLVNLYGNYIWSPATSWYARVSAGIFEEMYAGVAGEVLYRPFGRRWAVGVDVNRVRKRAFNQRFSFLKYTVTTGFVNFYYQVPYQHLLFAVSAGRYLARDYGATFTLAREFDSGIVAGAFFTKTNVSAKRFGEGSFDKGLFISIPLDLGFPASSRRFTSIGFRPLTRDGGQRAFDGPSLYGVTDSSDLQHIVRGWQDVLQ